MLRSTTAMKKLLAPPPVSSSTDHHFRNYKFCEEQNRLSVREIVSRFEKKLTAPANNNLSDEIEILLESLEKHMLVQELRDAMESLRGRVAGQNKNYVHKAIAMIEALAVHHSTEKEEAKRIKDFLEKLEMSRMETCLFVAEEIGSSYNVLDEWVWVES